MARPKKIKEIDSIIEAKIQPSTLEVIPEAEALDLVARRKLRESKNQ